MAVQKISSDLGFQQLAYTWAKIIPRHLTNTGKLRKAIRDLKKMQG